jgi:hypothetical protein
LPPNHPAAGYRDIELVKQRAAQQATAPQPETVEA